MCSERTSSWKFSLSKKHWTSKQVWRGLIWTLRKKKLLVEKFLQDMGLVSCQDTLIGHVELKIRGNSSGQNKRLALALALISNPSIIPLDEPTSKVDSSGAT